MSIQFTKEFLNLIGTHGDPKKLQDLKLLYADIADDIHDKILDKSKKRTLTSSEIDFLKSMHAKKIISKPVQLKPIIPLDKFKKFAEQTQHDHSQDKTSSCKCGLCYKLKSLKLN